VQLRDEHEIAVWTAAIASTPGRDTHAKMRIADEVVDGFRERTSDLRTQAEDTLARLNRVAVGLR
jgi:hypothetical protein